MNLPVKPQIHKISHVDWISFAVIVAFLVVVAIAIYLEIYPSSIVNGSGGFILHEEDKVFLLHIGSMILLLSIFIIRTVTNHVKRSSDEKFSALEKYHVVLHQKIIEMTRGQLEGNGARWVFDKMLDDLLELTSSEDLS